MRAVIGILGVVLVVGGCVAQSGDTASRDSSQTSGIANPTRLLSDARSALSRNDYSEAARLAKSASAHRTSDSIGALADSIVRFAEGRGQAIEDSVARERQVEIARRQQERAEEDHRRRRLLAGLSRKHDEVEQVDWYFDQPSSRYVNSSSRVIVYLGVRSRGAPWLRFAIRYTAASWLFIEDYTFSIDGETSRFVPASRVQRDNDTRIWEWVDGPVDEQMEALLLRIASSRRTVLRYNGRQYYRDRTISEPEKAGMRRVLNAYHGIVDTVSGRR